MKTILVTGCAGFIGSNFCRLYERELKIIGLDVFTRGSHVQNVSSEIQFYQIDIISESPLDEIFEAYPEIEGIINFAAESHVDHSIMDDALFWTTNVGGVRNLARQAQRQKIRLLQVSTDEVYGPTMDGAPASETDIMNPRNPYAASKAAAELMLKSYHESFGLDCVITRGSNTVGPRQSMDKLIPKVISYFLDAQPFPLYRTPAKRMWLSVVDHCRAIMNVFLNARAGSIYNISPDSENEIETAEVVERIQALMGKGTIKIVEDRAAYDLRYLISSKRLKSDLGWEPTERMPQVLEQTVRWYLDNLDWMQAASRGTALATAREGSQTHTSQEIL